MHAEVFYSLFHRVYSFNDTCPLPVHTYWGTSYDLHRVLRLVLLKSMCAWCQSCSGLHVYEALTGVWSRDKFGERKSTPGCSKPIIGMHLHNFLCLCGERYPYAGHYCA